MFVNQAKNKRGLLSKLYKRGIDKHDARKTVYSNQGIWKMSHERVVEKAYSVEWFTWQLGVKLTSGKRLDHWFDIKKWVKLA